MSVAEVRPENLDLVGTAGAAEILDMLTGSVSRLYHEGKLPQPVAEIEQLTPVWHAADIHAYAKGDTPEPAEKLALISTAGARDLVAGVLGRNLDKAQINRWRRAGKFPKPAYELKAGKTTYPLWWEQDICDFAASL